MTKDEAIVFYIQKIKPDVFMNYNKDKTKLMNDVSDILYEYDPKFQQLKQRRDELEHFMNDASNVYNRWNQKYYNYLGRRVFDSNTLSKRIYNYSDINGDNAEEYYRRKVSDAENHMYCAITLWKESDNKITEYISVYENLLDEAYQSWIDGITQVHGTIVNEIFNTPIYKDKHPMGGVEKLVERYNNGRSRRPDLLPIKIIREFARTTGYKDLDYVLSILIERYPDIFYLK